MRPVLARVTQPPSGRHSRPNPSPSRTCTSASTHLQRAYEEGQHRFALLEPAKRGPLTLESRQLIGSRQVALEVVRLLRDVVAGAKFSSFQQLVDHLEEVGRLLQEAGPKGARLCSHPLLPRN